ncbi:MAG: PIN domain nuclease [Geobacteraceae bacterium]
MILIDASAFIEFLNRTGSREDTLIEQLIRNDEDIVLADITLTEILQGIKTDREYRDVKASLLTFPLLSLNSAESYIAAAELYRKCRKKGLTVRSTVDLLIAQIAIEHRTALLHNDRDFECVTSRFMTAATDKKGRKPAAAGFPV